MASSDAFVPGPSAVDISPDQDKGVLKEIVNPGEGDETPCKGNKVFVHYTGKLTDGTVFDSSVERGELFQFTLGKGEVIKAWDIGVATMKKGEKCVLVCQPEYAYGKKGSPPKIPGNSILVFEVELFKWEMEDLSPDFDKGILRSVITDGEGFATPVEGCNVEVHLVGRCEGKQFEEKDVKFELGIGCEVGITKGVEIALKKFQNGEKSKIIVAPKYGYGNEGNSALNVPPNATIEYEVTLLSFEKEKETWNMTLEEKIEQSEIVKGRGTDYFKDGKYELAIKMYSRIINYLQQESDSEGENKLKINALVLAGYLNLAACYLKLEKYEEAVQNCDKALEIDPKSTKGKFRKGQAKLALRDYEVAKECFLGVLGTDASTDRAALRNISSCKEYLRKELEKEKKMYQQIFKKIAEEDMKSDSISEDSHTQENKKLDETETDIAPAPAEAVPV